MNDKYYSNVIDFIIKSSGVKTFISLDIFFFRTRRLCTVRFGKIVQLVKRDDFYFRVIRLVVTNLLLFNLYYNIIKKRIWNQHNSALHKAVKWYSGFLIPVLKDIFGHRLNWYVVHMPTCIHIAMFILWIQEIRGPE